MIEAINRSSGAFSQITTDVNNVASAVSRAVTGGGSQTNADPFAGLRATVSKTRAELETFYTQAAQNAGKVLGQDIPQASQLATNDLAKFYERVNDVNVEVPKATNNLENLARQFAFWETIRQASEAIKQFGENIAEFLGEGVKRAMEAETIEVNLSNALKINLDPGATNLAETMSLLKAKAEEIGVATMFSDVEILGVMEHLAANGITAQTTLDGAAQSIAYLAQATKSDLQPAALVTTEILHGMGRTLERDFGGNIGDALAHVTDTLVNLKLTTGGTLQDVATTMKYVGPVADEFRMKFEDIGTAMAVLYRSGIRGSQAGTALRRMLTNIAAPTDKAAEAIGELAQRVGLSGNMFVDAQGNVKELSEVQRLLYESTKDLSDAEKAHYIHAIFGQYALQSMMKVAGTAPKEFEELARKVNQTGTAFAVSAEQMGTGTGKFDMMVENINIAKKKLGEGILESLKPIMDAVANLAASFASLPQPVLNTIGAIMAFVAGFAIVVGTVGSAIAGFALLNTGLAAAGTTLGAVAATVGLVAAGIAGAIAVGVLLYEAWMTNFGGIRDLVLSVWEYIRPAFVDGMTAVKDAVTTAIDVVVAWWARIAPDFSAAIQAILAIVQFFAPVWKAFWDSIVQIVKVIWETLKGVIEGAWNVITGIFQAFIHLITGDWSKLWEDIKQIFSGFVEILTSLFSGLWDGLTALFSSFVSILTNALTQLVGALIGIVVGFGQVIAENWDSIWNGIKSIFKIFANILVGDWSGALDQFANLIGVKKERIIGGVRNVIDAIASWFSALPGRMYDWAVNAIDMFINGIGSMVGKVKDAATSVADALKKYLGFASPTELGPASNADEWMPNMMSMFADGIEKSRKLVRNAVADVATDVSVGVNGKVDGYALAPSIAGRSVVQNNNFVYQGNGKSDDFERFAQFVVRKIGATTA